MILETFFQNCTWMINVWNFDIAPGSLDHLRGAQAAQCLGMRDESVDGIGDVQRNHEKPIFDLSKPSNGFSSINVAIKHHHMNHMYVHDFHRYFGRLRVKVVFLFHDMDLPRECAFYPLYGCSTRENDDQPVDLISRNFIWCISWHGALCVDSGKTALIFICWRKHFFGTFFSQMLLCICSNLRKVAGDCSYSIRRIFPMIFCTCSFWKTSQKAILSANQLHGLPAINLTFSSMIFPAN